MFKSTVSAALLVGSLPLALLGEEEDMALLEQYYPKLPDPPSCCDEMGEVETPLPEVPLKGIVVYADPNKELDTLPEREGIHLIDLWSPEDAYFLEQRLEHYLGSPISQDLICDIKKSITGYYCNCYCPIVLVEVPEQNVSDGIITLYVFPGQIANICVEGNCHFSAEDILKGIHLCPGDYICEPEVARNLHFINQNPFRQINLIYSPAEEIGKTDLVFSTCDRRTLRLYAGTDNRGIRTTDEELWYAGLNWGNVFGLSHLFAYQFIAAYDWRRFKAHSFQYFAPINWNQHILNIYGGFSKARPDVPVGIKKMTGKSSQVSGRYSIPFAQSLCLAQWFMLGYDYKRTNNTIESSETFLVIGPIVTLTQFVFGYTGYYEQSCYRFDFNLELFWSPGRWLKHQKNSDYDMLRPGAKNQWVYGRGQLSYIHQLPWWCLTFFSRFIGQLSSEPLLPSEQLGIGGYNSVRGYEERQLNMDNGFIANLELRTCPWDVFGCCGGCDGLQFLVFWDSGVGKNKERIPGTEKSDWLMGIGPGLRFTYDPYFTARLDWGYKLHRDDFAGGIGEFHFNVTASY